MSKVHKFTPSKKGPLEYYTTRFRQKGEIAVYVDTYFRDQTGKLWVHHSSAMLFDLTPVDPCPFCIGRTGRVSVTCEDCMGSGIAKKEK